MDFQRSKVIDRVLQGGVIAYPTETIWGLGGDANSDVATESIFEIKGRNQTQALSVLVSNLLQLNELAELDEKSERLLEVFWPGPFALILKPKRPFANCRPGERKILIRPCPRPLAQQNIHELLA